MSIRFGIELSTPTLGGSGTSIHHNRITDIELSTPTLGGSGTSPRSVQDYGADSSASSLPKFQSES